MRVSLGFYRLLLYVAFTRVAYSLLTTAAIQEVEQTDYDEREWRCQHSGICSWCPFCPTCQMPEAECGYCKFCDSINCPESNKQCVGDICNPFLGNIKADTLLEIDVNREYPQAQPHISPQVSTAAQCCKACMDRAGCNAWTYCAGVEGCGIGCSDELLRPYGSCIEDRYPPFLCSLKVVRDPSAPELWLEDGSQWVSGVVLGEPSSPASEEQEQLLVDPFVEALSE